MQILVQADGPGPVAELRRLVVRRLRFALQRLRARVIAVRVHLSDENGPRGGLDKRARLQVVLPQGGATVLHDRDHRWPDLIDRLVDRAARAVVRRAGRDRADHRTPRDRARPWSRSPASPATPLDTTGTPAPAPAR